MIFMRALLGLVIFIAIAYAMSSSRKKIPWKLVGIGVALQWLFAILILKTDMGNYIFDKLGIMVTTMLNYSDDGARFIFGQAFEEHYFAFKVLPTIIFVSALMSVLYYSGIMQKIVGLLAWIMQRTLKTSGAESLAAAANVFVGQTEAPLVVRPYLAKMTQSELMALMVGGFATVAGGVMAAYIGILNRVGMTDIAEHLIMASVISAPASLVLAKILQPETEIPVTQSGGQISDPLEAKNMIDAASQGAAEGVKLAINVAGMLIAFIALIALINGILGWMSGIAGLNDPLTLELILGYLFAPFAWLIGIANGDLLDIGQLLGIRTAINEFVAYEQMATMITDGAISHRSATIASYALCGFANFSSIGIQLGGIGPLAPTRKHDLAKIGLKAMIGGTLATFMTAAIAGVLI